MMKGLPRWTLLGLICLAFGFGAGQVFTRSADSPPMKGVKLGDPMPENLFAELAKRTNPAVVSISITVPVGRPLARDPMLEMLEEFFGGGPGLSPRQLPPRAQALGTGFVIREDGYILTNSHVAREEGTIQVSMLDDPEKFYDAKVVGRDVRGDLSLLKIDAKKKLPYLQLGSSETVEVGQWVAAFGNPFGHSNTMTVGIISAKGRDLSEINRWPFLQTDASINQGNSGGPLVDTSGYVIGVNTAIDARAQGIGFAIPIEYVKSVLPILYKGGNVERGFIGVGINSVNSRIASYVGLKKAEGAMVTQIQPNGPAQKAGLREYDVIVEYNGKPITNAGELIQAVQDSTVGQKVKVKVMRPLTNGEGAKEHTFTIQVGPHPDDKRPTTMS